MIKCDTTFQLSKQLSVKIYSYFWSSTQVGHKLIQGSTERKNKQKSNICAMMLDKQHHHVQYLLEQQFYTGFVIWETPTRGLLDIGSHGP